MTGRAAGYCAGYGMPGYMNPVGGRGAGFGRGFGRGWGWRNQFYATGLTGWQRAGAGWGVPGYGYAPTAEQEKSALKAQAEYLEKSLGEIRKRMEELEKSKAE